MLRSVLEDSECVLPENARDVVFAGTARAGIMDNCLIAICAHVAPLLAGHSWIGRNRATEVNLISPHNLDGRHYTPFHFRPHRESGGQRIDPLPYKHTFDILGTCQF